MSIKLSNGHVLDFVIASGALAFDGKGWPWEWPMRWAGLIDTSLFTVVGKTLTLHPREGNLRWWKPWECVRHIPGGTVNKVGLTNPGFAWWYENIAPTIDSRRIKFVASIFGNREELIYMTNLLNNVDVVAIEINDSCPNTGHALTAEDSIIHTTHTLRNASRHPIIVKGSAAQKCDVVAAGITRAAEAMSLNSVPWEIAFPDGRKSPLAKLEARVGGGGGGISGQAAQDKNWAMLAKMKSLVPEMPVIAPDIWEYRDIFHVLTILKADAVSFGAIHLKKPFPFGAMLPTQYVRRYQGRNAQKKEV